MTQKVLVTVDKVTDLVTIRSGKKTSYYKTKDVDEALNSFLYKNNNYDNCQISFNYVRTSL